MRIVIEKSNGLERVLETLNTHYIFDARGRMVGSIDGGVLPRFVLGRAAEGCVWRFRSDLARDRVVALARLAGREPGASFDGELPAPPERLVALERLLRSTRYPDGPARASVSQIPVTRDGVTVGEIWRLE